MREFETTVILRPELSDAEVKNFTDRMDGIIKRFDGEVMKLGKMGKRSLAYPIQKLTKGNYLCFHYASKPGVVADMERSLRIDERVMRFLTISGADDIDVAARKVELENEPLIPIHHQPKQEMVRKEGGAIIEDDGDDDEEGDFHV